MGTQAIQPLRIEPVYVTTEKLRLAGPVEEK